MADEEQRDTSYDFPLSQQFQQDVSTLVYQLNTNDILEELKHTLRGESLNAHQEWERMKDEQGNNLKAKMNEVGIADIISFVQTFVSKNTFLSDLTEEDIRNHMKEAHQRLLKQIALNYKKYSMEISHRPAILYQILFFIFVGLRRAKDGDTLKAVTKIHSIMEKIDKSPKKEKALGFGSLFGR